MVSGMLNKTHRCSQDEETLTNNILPKREEFQWRPSLLLCKRFDIVDPFMGKVLYGTYFLWALYLALGDQNFHLEVSFPCFYGWNGT